MRKRDKIEKYIQGQLSDEAKAEFEKEIETNIELKEDLKLEQLIVKNVQERAFVDEQIEDAKQYELKNQNKENTIKSNFKSLFQKFFKYFLPLIVIFSIIVYITKDQDSKQLKDKKLEMEGKNELLEKDHVGDEIFIDERDGKVYPVISIGQQIWMKKNLAFNIEGSICYDDNCDGYGRYYTYPMAQKACPEGWKLPSKADFDKLINELGGPENAYPKLIEGKSNLNINLNGYFFNDASIEGLNDYGYLWTSTEEENGKAICLWLNKYEQSALQFGSNKEHYRNVRCVKGCVKEY